MKIGFEEVGAVEGSADRAGDCLLDWGKVDLITVLIGSGLGMCSAESETFSARDPIPVVLHLLRQFASHLQHRQLPVLLL